MARWARKAVECFGKGFLESVEDKNTDSAFWAMKLRRIRTEEQGRPFLWCFGHSLASFRLCCDKLDEAGREV